MPFEKKIICLMGPTASGKTDTAMYLSDQFPARIISVDSALIYQDMNIGTAKPDIASLTQYPHELIDIIPPTARYSAAEFREDALRLITDAFNQQQTPILVGGTFLYFKTLLAGISKLPHSNLEIQALLTRRAQEEGLQNLHDELRHIDPVSAERLHPNDSQRVIRALEVYLTSGKTLTEFWKDQQHTVFSYPFIKIALLPEDIEQGNIKIERRFKAMLAAGLIDEVQNLQAKYPELTIESTSQRAVGYRQTWEHLRGDYDATELCEKGIIATRQYAKRQRTWLKSEENLHIIPVNDKAPCAETFKVINQHFTFN